MKFVIVIALFMTCFCRNGKKIFIIKDSLIQLENGSTLINLDKLTSLNLE